MKRFNTVEEVINDLHQQFPQLIIDVKISGYVIDIVEDVVYARIMLENKEEYDCELEKHIFPQQELAPNIYFFILSGTINDKKFTHVNYFYWTQEQLDISKEQAKDLYTLLEEDTN